MPDTVEPSGGSRYPDEMEGRVSALEQLAQTTGATLQRIEFRFDNIDRRFDDVDRRFKAVDKRFEAVERRIDLLISEHHTDFRWLIALILAQSTAILGVMAHGFHWL
jgi:hypothetical protein